MTPVNEPPVVRLRQFAADAWAKYMSLWRAGRGGIAVALLLPCCLCSLCGSIVMVSGDDAPDPTATPRVEATARPTRTTRPSPSITHVVTREPTATDEPPTKVPTAVQPTAAPELPTEAPPAAIQPLLAVPPQQPAAPPPQPAAEIPRRGSPQGGSCPAGLPVKGNQGSPDWIYHVPGGRSYDRTDPEECFATPGDAESAGYRAARN